MPSTQNNYQLLKLGSKNASVKQFQLMLNQWRVAHGRRKIEPDTKFGNETFLAVCDFQRKEHLVVDGEVGGESWGRLTALVNAGFAPPILDGGGGTGALVYDSAPENEVDPLEFPANIRKVIFEAISTYLDELGQVDPIRLTVSKSAGNGNAPILTIQSGAFDSNKPAIVHTHYHGFFTRVGGLGGPHTANIKAHLSDDPQRVFVLPECEDITPAGETKWLNAKDQRRTTRDAISAMGIEHVERKVVSAHSGAGEPLSRFLRNKTLEADEIRMLDCLYGPDWPTITEKWMHDNPTCSVQIVIANINDQIGVRAKKIDALGGDQVDLIRANQIGNWVPHYAAVVSHLR